jgi:hypothetical protein
MTPAAVGAVPQQVDAVSAFRCGAAGQVASASIGVVGQAYAERTVAIIKAALSGDAASLDAIVAPGANFVVFHGDVGIGPRSAGADAAIAFVRQLAPTHYSVTAGSAGPFSTDPCGPRKVDVSFRSAKPGEATIARFSFERGLLTAVKGSSVAVLEGNLP